MQQPELSRSRSKPARQPPNHQTKRTKNKAQAQIEQEVQQAKEGLRQQVADLALTAAEQILNAEIDKTKHQDIITKVSNQLS